MVEQIKVDYRPIGTEGGTHRGFGQGHRVRAADGTYFVYEYRRGTTSVVTQIGVETGEISQVQFCDKDGIPNGKGATYHSEIVNYFREDGGYEPPPNATFGGFADPLKDKPVSEGTVHGSTESGPKDEHVVE